MQQERRKCDDRAALQYHASLVEVVADAVIATDAEFRVTLWNPAAERL